MWSFWSFGLGCLVNGFIGKTQGWNSSSLRSTLHCINNSWNTHVEKLILKKWYYVLELADQYDRSGKSSLENCEGLQKLG
jgi:hypothetical protein